MYVLPPNLAPVTYGVGVDFAFGARVKVDDFPNYPSLTLEGNLTKPTQAHQATPLRLA